MTPYQEAMERQVAKEGHFDVVSFRDGWNMGVSASACHAELAIRRSQAASPAGEPAIRKITDAIEALATPGSHARSRVDGKVSDVD